MLSVGMLAWLPVEQCILSAAAAAVMVSTSQQLVFGKLSLGTFVVHIYKQLQGL
jgi:hypothetical protein